MKLRRTLSGILFGVGCAMAFVGLLALILPAVANDQLQLVLASFSLPSLNPMVGLVNTCMSFALANGWQVLLVGAVLLTMGVTLFSRFAPEEEPTQPRELYRRPVPAAAEPLWEQPETARTGPNPFAETTLWEQYAPRIQPSPAVETTKVGFGSPMLEPNRIEEMETEPVIAQQVYARPASPPPSTPEPVIVEEQPVAEAESLLETENVPEEIPVKVEPVQAENQPQSGTPVQLSPRIRSTVGKRREW